MKIKLDENLPGSAAVRLRSLGHDVDTVLDEQIGGESDDVVWQHAQTTGRLLVTQDLDFSDIRRFAPGTHHGVLLVRMPDDAQAQLSDYLCLWLAPELAESYAGCFVVATPTKVRVLQQKTSR